MSDRPVQLQEVWVRLDRLAQKLWTEDKGAAAELKAVVDQFKERVGEVERSLAAFERSLDDKRRAAPTEELKRLYIELDERDELLKQAGARALVLSRELAARDKALSQLEERHLRDQAELLAMHAKNQELLLGNLRRREEAVGAREQSVDARSRELEEAFRRRLAELDARYAEAGERIAAEAARERDKLTRRLSTLSGGLEGALKDLESREAEVERRERELAKRGKASKSGQAAEGPPPSRPSSNPAPSLWGWLTPRKIFAACSIALGFAAYGLFSLAPAPIALPISHTAGLIASEKGFRSVDWMNQELFLFDPAAGLVSEVRHLPNPFVTGLAAVPNAIWSLDGDSNQILRHRLSDLTVEARYPAPGEEAAGLAVDASSIWVGDGGGFIYRLKRPGLERTAVTRMLSKPVDIWYQAGELWVVDGQSKLHVLRARDLALLRTVSLRDRLPKGAKPTGIAARDGRLWVITEKPAALVSLPAP